MHPVFPLSFSTRFMWLSSTQRDGARCWTTRLAKPEGLCHVMSANGRMRFSAHPINRSKNGRVRVGKTGPKQGGMSGVAFDAGGLIALDRSDRRVIALLARATQLRMRITIPATALAQAIRNPAGQARLSRLIRQSSTDVVPLSAPDATAVGLLLARTKTSDIAHAHVVICARRSGQVVVTSDPGDLNRIDPDLRMLTV